MNPKNDSNNSNNQDILLELFLSGDERVIDLSLKNDISFKELTSIEESLYASIHYGNSNYLDSILDNDSPILESFDIAKANSNISESKNIPLPLYLKN